MGTVLDITGQTYGRLTAVELAELRPQKNGKHLAHWLCKCTCGNTVVVSVTALRCGNTKSCGCLSSEKTAERNKKSAKHMARANGKSERLYRIWCGIKGRCYNQSDDAFEDYGARGITMCDEWKSDYAAFKTWAINSGYKNELSIDRVDNNAGYTPCNCRWATPKQQANNRRNNILVEYNGKRQSISDWSKDTGFSYRMISTRLKAGWEVEKALEYPSKRNKGGKSNAK